MSDVQSLYNYWIRGLGGIAGGIEVLIRDKLPCSTYSTEQLESYLCRLKQLLEQMKELAK